MRRAGEGVLSREGGREGVCRPVKGGWSGRGERDDFCQGDEGICRLAGMVDGYLVYSSLLFLSSSPSSLPYTLTHIPNYCATHRWRPKPPLAGTASYSVDWGLFPGVFLMFVSIFVYDRGFLCVCLHKYVCLYICFM